MAFPSPTKVIHNTVYASISPSRPELSTKGRVILITGGGAGLGPVIAEAFATAGSTKIAILGRSLASLESTKTSLESSHPGLTVLPIVADITDGEAVKEAFASVKKQLGPIDVLVSNAAYMPDNATIATAGVAEWWRGMEVNVKGNFNLAQAFLANKAEKGSVVVSFTTGPAHFPGAPMPGWSGYMVSKAAASKVMDYLASENPDVRVHILHPGVLATEMGRKGEEAGLVFPHDDCKLPSSDSDCLTGNCAEWC